MSKRLLFVILSTMALSLAASAQTTDPNPAHTPDVFLDNHRPIAGKKGKAPTSRSVTGKVVDSSGQVLQGALVTLTDPKTNEETTIITKKDGRYSFDDLSFTQDYLVAARYKDLVSEPKKLSQYDHSATIVRILEVAAKPKATAEAKKENPHPNE